MSHLENAFTAKIYFTGYPLQGTLAFQYIKNVSSDSKQGKGLSTSGNSTVATLVQDDYLYGVTDPAATAALFHFEPVGDLGRYVVTVVEPAAYRRQYLGISNLSYTRAYTSVDNSNHFWFTRSDESVVTLKDFAGTTEGLTLQCIKGPVKFWDDGKIIRAANNPNQWSLYTGVSTQGDSLNGKIKLIVIQRNVSKD